MSNGKERRFFLGGSASGVIVAALDPSAPERMNGRYAFPPSHDWPVSLTIRAKAVTKCLTDSVKIGYKHEG